MQLTEQGFSNESQVIPAPSSLGVLTLLDPDTALISLILSYLVLLLRHQVQPSSYPDLRSFPGLQSP